LGFGLLAGEAFALLDYLDKFRFCNIRGDNWFAITVLIVSNVRRQIIRNLLNELLSRPTFSLALFQVYLQQLE
jgi:CRISPR/Cas system endoribonuclease Cas6 (RAMP superfamily)